MPPQKTTQVTHFEKTVEWKYVAECLKTMFGAPLAGLHEKAGDALVSDGSRLLIIEFKRRSTGTNTESDKYVSMDAKAVKKLPKGGRDRIQVYAFREIFEDEKRFQDGESNCRPAPHAFVFGDIRQKVIEDRTFNILDKLIASRYWGSWANNHSYFDKSGLAKVSGRHLNDTIPPQPNIKTIVNDLGEKGGAFREYVDRLVNAKGGYDEAASGDWMYANVAGTVQLNGTDTPVIMSLWEYAHATEMYDLCLAFAERDAKDAVNNASRYKKIVEARAHQPSNTEVASTKASSLKKNTSNLEPPVPRPRSRLRMH